MHIGRSQTCIVYTALGIFRPWGNACGSPSGLTPMLPIYLYW